MKSKSNLNSRFKVLIELFLLDFSYYLVWIFYYQKLMPHPYLGRGKYVLIGIYLLLVTIVIYLCDGFKFGTFKLIDIIISQWVSMLIVNTITYFQLCLISNAMITFLPMLLLTAIDYLMCYVLAYIYTVIYHKNVSPKKMIMVYNGNNALELIYKMNTRTDKYHVLDKASFDEDYNQLLNKISSYDAVIINDVPSEKRNDLVKYCYMHNIQVYLVPKISDILIEGGESISLFDTPLTYIDCQNLSVEEDIVKRFFDILLSGLALILLSPLMLIVSLAIKFEDGGPVFFRQDRVTKDNKVFNILKFRSMVVDAEKGGYDLNLRATDKDPRITKVGSFIRKCRIDELPQLINILKGDMSIVGPRPERVENVEAYTKEIPEFILRHKAKGGLTGYAQIYGKYNTSAYDKLRLDLMYIQNYSLLLDIKLIFSTLRILFKSESTEGFEKKEDANNG